ncbi:glutathione-disulfide reductase [soil metagenome]
MTRVTYTARSMTTYDVDLFVIGGGSGGVRAARVAANHGARVAIAEHSKWGGTCVVRGCVPKKLMVYASEVRRTLEDARGQGWTVPEATFDWPTFIAAKDKEIARLSKGYSDRLSAAGVRLIDGKAVLTDAHTLEVSRSDRTGTEKLTAANILVATGGAPRLPHTGRWISSDEAFHIPELPARIAIMGAGYVGVEFAHIFAGFGSQVTLVHRGGVLNSFDPDIALEVTKGMIANGIEIVEADGVEGLEYDVAMAAIGRAPLSGGLGLAEIGVHIDPRGGIVVDDYSRTSVPHVFAVGDVTARVALTPVAIREGHAVADTLFGGRPTPVHHDHIPTAVFSQPPAATVGLTEPAALAGGREIQIYKARFRPMRYALSGRDEHVLIKLIVEKQTDRVLGLHMVGIDSPEIVQSAAIAITMNATKADFDRTFALHPTTSEELVLMR